MSIQSDLGLMLKEFEKIRNDIPDDKSALPTLINYLRGFLRTKDPKYVLPSAEVMTILKNEKPNSFYLLKRQGSSNPSLELLTQLEMDYDLAKQRLEDLKSKLN